MENQPSDIELLIVLCHYMVLFGAAAFIGCLIADYIIEPVLVWMDLIKALLEEDQ